MSNNEPEDVPIQVQEMGLAKVKKVWFWLTCWRPITKYELAKFAQSMLAIYNKELQSRISADNLLAKHINTTANKKFDEKEDTGIAYR